MKRFEKGPQSPSPTNNELKSFQELAALWQEKYPEALHATADQQEAQAAAVAAREQVLDDRELETLLTEYGIDPANLEQAEDGYYRLPVVTHFSEQRLPEGYGYKGGAARALLLRSLGIDRFHRPRDIDVVRIASQEAYPGSDHEVAEQFMPDDYQHGDGVEVITERDHYFNSRDFTINEVLATDTEIFATRQCLLDTTRRVIRLTEFRRSGRGRTPLLAKMLRFYAQAIHDNDEVTLEEVEEWDFEPYSITPFWLALHLDRAFSQGEDVAQRYTDVLIGHQQLTSDIRTARQAADYLLETMELGNFYYRHAPKAQFEQEQQWLDEFEYLPKFRGHGKSRGEE